MSALFFVKKNFNGLPYSLQLKTYNYFNFLKKTNKILSR